MDSATFMFVPQPQRREEVERVLRALSEGVASAGELESAVVDIKEEAGRRDTDGAVLPGSARNDEAAEGLAEAAACMANSAGGGALVVGVDDKTGQIIGATTEPQWLRSRIYDLTDREASGTGRSASLSEKQKLLGRRSAPSTRTGSVPRQVPAPGGCKVRAGHEDRVARGSVRQPGG